MTDPPTARPRSGVSPLALLALAAVALLGLTNLAQPFTWDQAMFALGGERIARGGALYRDFWDTKQPGIYWFFAAASRAFGPGERGAHALELVWMLALAWYAWRIAARACASARVAAFAPLLTVGAYEAIASDWHLTQVEGLVGLPLLIALERSLSAAESPRGRGRRFALSGAAGAIVLLFKLALAPPLALFWLADLVLVARTTSGGGGARARAAALAALAIAGGLAVPAAAALAWLAALGVLPLALWTWFTFPRLVLARLHGWPIRNLVDSGAWFILHWAPILPLAALGGWLGARDPQDRLSRRLLAWLAAGYAVLLAQRWSGWQYHYMMFFVPLGLLATRGLDRLAPALRNAMSSLAPRERAVALAVAFATLFAVPLANATAKLAYFVHDRGARSPALLHRALLRGSKGNAYLHYEQVTEFLRGPQARPGPIYALGNPLTYWLSGRRPPTGNPGCALTQYTTADQWLAIVADVDRARTPYILVDDDQAHVLATPEARPMLALMSARYRPFLHVLHSTWFERSDADSASASAGP